jgi:hypothetical protein
VTTTDTPHTDPQAARQARRTALRNLITRVGRGRAGADIGTMLGLAVDAEIADADEAHTRLADYENRISWETTCGEHARLLDACRAADERVEKADAVLVRVRRQLAVSDASADALLKRAEQAEATVARVREIGSRLTAQAAAFQDVLDDSDRDPWASTIRAGLDELRTALDGTGNAEPEPAPERNEPTIAPDDEAAGQQRCVCGDPIERWTGPGDPRWIHSPGSDTTCTNARPRCTCAGVGFGTGDCAVHHAAEGPCFHPSWETETTLGARRCTDCGEWLDPEPAALDGAALWATIRQHAARDHQFWTNLTHNHNRLHGHGVTR